MSGRFADRAGLARHLQKHVDSPLRCAYEGKARSTDRITVIYCEVADIISPPLSLSPSLLLFHPSFSSISAGCDQSFSIPLELLHHHQSSRHRNGVLRKSSLPSVRAEDPSRQPLSPWPDVLPAYMSVSRRVSKHPVSKERHQWLGPKVGTTYFLLR